MSPSSSCPTTPTSGPASWRTCATTARRPTSTLADYDHDGVAAGVIFHGSMNMEPIPFVPSALGRARPQGDKGDRELTGVGQTIYNRWLAAYVPMWDVEAAVAEVEWAHDAGLRGVNFLAMRDGALPEYNRSVWEPLWSVCEERGMPLVTHVGAGTNARYSGLEGVPLLQIESGGFVARRAVWWLVFAGVFERHPGLKLVITETPGNWFPSTAVELDAVWAFYDSKRAEPLNEALLEQVPRRPSEYMASNVYYGASFASSFEGAQAVAHGLDSQLLWGSDYPHLEGTFVYREGSDLPSVTRLALRNTFCGVPSTATLRMVGQNAIDIYGLDADALRAIAAGIGAPTLDELATPIDRVPEGASVTAFRSGAGGWG